MSSVPAIALSGLNAATTSLGATAHNVANQGTAGFKRQIASTQTTADGGVTSRLDTAPAPGHAPDADMVGLLTARHAFGANLVVFRTADQMTGALLDIRA